MVLIFLAICSIIVITVVFFRDLRGLFNVRESVSLHKPHTLHKDERASVEGLLPHNDCYSNTPEDNMDLSHATLTAEYDDIDGIGEVDLSNLAPEKFESDAMAEQLIAEKLESNKK